MTLCIVCPSRGPDDPGHDPDYERGYLCCFRAWSRMAGALRAIPDLVDELQSLGRVERDGRDSKVLYPPTHARAGQLVAHFDPVANGFTAGPVPQPTKWSRVTGTRPAREPTSLDRVDLTYRVNHEARRLLARGALGLDDDQVGHLSAATILDGWVRDWATYRDDGPPTPSVRRLAGWLLDRLDWACRTHPALDEFAEDLRELRGTLDAMCGHFDAPPETLSAPCWGCGWLTLIRDGDAERVLCAAPSTRECSRLMTDDDYAEYAQQLIKENPS